jgi:hypothetical protein
MMSEYQYYEFVAIDEPLTPKQMMELRARAFVTREHYSDQLRQ